MSDQDTLSDADQALFRRMNADCTPLEHDKISHSAQPTTTDAKPVVVEIPTPVYCSEFIEHLHPEQQSHYHRDAAHKLWVKRMQQGRIPVKAELDLHGYTCSEAEAALMKFLHRKQQRDYACCVLIIHGKGTHSPSDRTTLKSYVCHRLKQLPYVLAYASAQPHDGGAGALYAIIDSVS